MRRLFIALIGAVLASSPATADDGGYQDLAWVLIETAGLAAYTGNWRLIHNQLRLRCVVWGDKDYDELYIQQKRSR